MSAGGMADLSSGANVFLTTPFVIAGIVIAAWYGGSLNLVWDFTES
jgi:hypothetical protein